MPNWATNYVIVRHADKTMIDKLIAGFEQNKLFHALIPVPAHLNDECADQEAILASKLATDPSINGYQTFACLKWGTKWDTGKDRGAIVQVAEDGRKLVLSFDTAWCAPEKAFETWAAMGFEVQCYTEECGMQTFVFLDYANDVQRDFAQSESSGSEIAEAAPELDKLFGLKEMIDERWECLNEEEEEETESTDEQMLEELQDQTRQVLREEF